MHVPTYVAAWGKISMSKTFYKTIEGKKINKKSNAVVFKGFLSRFSAFLCMASPKTSHKYFHIGLEKSHKSQKKYIPTYVASAGARSRSAGRWGLWSPEKKNAGTGFVKKGPLQSGIFCSLSHREVVQLAVSVA